MIFIDLPLFLGNVQCQSQLKRLYADGIKGCHMEFSAYNLLCIILHSNNKRELSSLMTRYAECLYFELVCYINYSFFPPNSNFSVC